MVAAEVTARASWFMTGNSLPLTVRWEVQECPIGKITAIFLRNVKTMLIYIGMNLNVNASFMSPASRAFFDNFRFISTNGTHIRLDIRGHSGLEEC